jgi:hypothetical protein
MALEDREIDECEFAILIDCSIVALTAGLEKLASLITLLTLGSSRIETMSCSNSTFTANKGCCCCSGHPLL